MNQRLNEANAILRTLHDAGHDAYIVGGYVRDHLLGRPSDDIDITTSATPDEVDALFSRVKHTGKKFGGVTILHQDHSFEVTTFRKEGEYVQHRYPKDVTFSKRLADDVVRRDFTINALAMDDTGRIIDLVDGRTDLETGILRAIGNPGQRFREDALRILRAFRFVSKLGFTLDPATSDAIFEHKHLIRTIKVERVMQELDKIVTGEHARMAYRAMIETGVHAHLHGLAKGIETVANLDTDLTPIEFYLIAFILDDIDDVWRFSNRDLRLIHQVIQLHEVTKNDHFNKYLLFSYKLEPCLLANRISVLLGYPDQEETVHRLWNEMPVKEVCDLAFKGQDILELTTLRSRKIIGLVIDDLLREVLEGTKSNTYDELKPYALQRIEQLQASMEEDNE